MKKVKEEVKDGKQHLLISPPNMKHAVFTIEGTEPLVIHRFSQKAKQKMLDKMKKGSAAARKVVPQVWIVETYCDTFRNCNAGMDCNDTDWKNRDSIGNAGESRTVG